MPTERRLTDADLPAACGLSMAAGWNQVADDWRVMLAQGRAIGLEAPDPDARLIASALTLPLAPRLAWISMVLVDAAWRRRGLGTRLLERCIAALSEHGVTAGLDATPAGRLVYLPLGFEALYGISRLLVEPAEAMPRDTPTDVAMRPLSAADLDALASWDAARSGMRRGPLLASLQARLPAAAWLATRADRIVGFVLGRNGRLSNQIGPVMADYPTIARALLARALIATRAAAILDIPDCHADLQAWLQGQGAVIQRGYTRMVLGATDLLPSPEPLFAIAGPELG
jgi:GNAT superfamily N-acetyltransferase